jgi:hypothetical protein
MVESAEEFLRLRKSADPSEYKRAVNESATLGIWKDIIERYPEMKIWVIHNKSVPVEILTALSADEDPMVREAVARKRRCPVDRLYALATDPDVRVRQAVSYNAKATTDILAILAQDSSPIVADQAKSRIKGPRHGP